MPTPIEWCDETFNPWWGCERVSPACAHCYADTFAKRLGMSALWPRNIHGDIHGFRFFGDKYWDEPLRWAAKLPAKLGRRPRVFCASMADVFEERDELEQPRDRLFALIEETAELDWLILTKRPEFAARWLDGSYGPEMPGNIWLGVSIENARYTWRADKLRQVPAALRFISAEPLLGSLFSESRPAGRASGEGPSESLSQGTGSRPEPSPRRAPLDLTGIGWVIIGGESGPKARPFHLEHAREIINAAHGVAAELEARAVALIEYGNSLPDGVTTEAFAAASLLRREARDRRPAVFVKQLGAQPMYPGGGGFLYLRDRKGGDPAEWPADLRIREFARTAVHA